MQKILCKSTTCSTPVLSTPVNSFAAGFISLGFKTPVKNLTPYSTSKPLSTCFFSTSAMPTKTASISSGGVGFSSYLQRSVHRPAPASVRFSTAGYRTCRCSIDGGIRSTNRAWVGRTGTWRALFCSESNVGLSTVNATAGAVGESEGDSDGEDEEEKDEKPVRMSRRSRSSNGSGEFVGNPDLLKIPGVGLRNQRKLVDNGIGDVAELKKLYKDKVFLNLQF